MKHLRILLSISVIRIANFDILIMDLLMLVPDTTVTFTFLF